MLESRGLSLIMMMSSMRHNNNDTMATYTVARWCSQRNYIFHIEYLISLGVLVGRRTCDLCVAGSSPGHSSSSSVIVGVGKVSIPTS